MLHHWLPWYLSRTSSATGTNQSHRSKSFLYMDPLSHIFGSCLAPPKFGLLIQRGEQGHADDADPPSSLSECRKYSLVSSVVQPALPGPMALPIDHVYLPLLETRHLIQAFCFQNLDF